MPKTKQASKQKQDVKKPEFKEAISMSVGTGDMMSGMKPPTAAELTAAEAKMEAFTKFYKELGIVPEEDWPMFLKTNMTSTPVTFRILESHRLIPAPMDSIPGIPSQGEVLKEYVKKKHVASLNQLKVEQKQVELKTLPWFPKELLWSVNVNEEEMNKYLGFKMFQDFLQSEKVRFNLLRTEVWSMVPALLLDVQPYHKVLDMCCAPGYIASIICEVLHSDPNMAHEGILVLNDRDKSRVNPRMCCGIKSLILQNDARKFPEIYLAEERINENRLRYDRIVCDVRCSNDGTMRKNTLVRAHWKPYDSLKYHSNQKDILRRALELLQFGGRVLYSTTSYNPIENEAVVLAVLKEAEGAVDIVECRNLVPGFVTRPGVTKWKVQHEEDNWYENWEESSESFKNSYTESIFPLPEKEMKPFHLERCVRAVPQDNDSAGFFCAVLTKKRELPWVIAKQKEELAKKKEEEDKKKGSGGDAAKEEPEVKPPKYPFRIVLKTNVQVTEMEWTTEVTNTRGDTKTSVATETSKMPAMEISPDTYPKPLAGLEADDDPHKFMATNDEEWIKIKAFYKISDDFDASWMFKRPNQNYFLCTPLVQGIINYNKTRLHLDKDYGVKIARGVLHPPSISKCSIALTNAGFGFLYPYINKQVVNLSRDDFLRLFHDGKMMFDKFSDQAKADAQEAENGCCLFIYRPEGSDADPKCNITFTGWRGDKWVSVEKEEEDSHVFRLAGMEMSDMKKKIQDEKIAKIMAEQEEKEKNKDENKEEK